MDAQTHYRLGEEQRKKLLEILNKKLSPDELRVFAFVVRGPGAYDDLKGQNITDKSISLLEFLIYRNQIGKLIDFLKETRPDIPLPDLEPTSEITSALPIEFINRRKEIDRLTELRSPQYQLVDAPAGYGKTELLKEVAGRYREIGWLSVYVDASSIRVLSLEEIIRSIVDQASSQFEEIRDFATSKEWARRMGYQVAGCLIQRLKEIQSLSSIYKEGVILLLDSIELLSDSVAALLLNEFIPGIQDGLQNAGNKIPLKAIFAGRYISSRWTNFVSYVPANVLLTPFDFSVVKHTVQEFAKSSNVFPSSGYIDQIASLLMCLTAGHPDCIVKILAGFQFVWPAEEYFSIDKRGREHFQNVVLPIVNKIRKMYLRDELDTLSPCRRYTPTFLKRFIEMKLISHSDEYRLADELTSTYLVTREDGFLQDGVTRRLLALRLRYEDTKRYIEICQASKKIYLEFLSDLQTTRPEIVAIELLYQDILLISYYSSNYSERRELFFSALDEHLKLLVDGRDFREMVANLTISIEKDWEFQFTINHYLQETQYSDEPYKELRKRIDQF